MLTAVVIAKNEEENINRCLESLRFCPEILVITNNSADKTAVIAARFGAKVVNFTGSNDYSALRNQGLDLAGNQWVLFVDADEIVTGQLNREILKAVKLPDFNGFYLHRADYLWGKRLYHGDVGGVYLLRLGKKDAGRWSGKVHETWEIQGKTGRLKEQLSHYPHPTLDAFLRSVNRYSSIRAKELFNNGIRSGLFQIVFYPMGKFFYLWIYKLGILDGFVGLIHALVMSFYSFLVRGKLYLLGKNIPDSYYD